MQKDGKTFGSDSSSEQSQVIFSTPDLSVNSENLEEIKPELSEENKSRIASAFAQTDATQQRQQITGETVVAEQTPASNSIASTATEDIVLDGTKKKRVKIPFLIGTLVILAAIAAGVALAVSGVLDSS